MYQLTKQHVSANETTCIS